MKATDFKLANLVQDKLTNEILICSGINCDFDGKNTEISFSVLNREKYPLPNGWKAEPIPITEEWLLRFGYKGSVESNFFEKDCSISNAFKTHTIWIPFNRFLDNHYRIHIEYVHQLQNLYFALTGEELILLSAT